MKISWSLRRIFSVALFIGLIQNCHCNSFVLVPPTVAGAKMEIYDVYIDQKFNSHEVDLINQATEEWEDKTDHIITYHLYYNFDMHNYNNIHNKRHSIAMIKLSRFDDKAIELDLEVRGNILTNYVLGYYDSRYSTPVIYIITDRMIGDEYERSVIEHECGHSLGLDHNPKQNTLMYASQDYSSKHITHDDIIEFCKIHHCDIKKLK